MIGDKVLLFIDPTNSKGANANPAPMYYLLDYTVKRGAVVAAVPNWSNGTYAAGNGINWSTSVDPQTVKVKVLGQDYPQPNNQPGYAVEIQIPFTAINYQAGDEQFPNIGVAFMVFDDDGFTYPIQGAETEAFTGVGFPDDSVNLSLNDANVPAQFVDPTSDVTDFAGTNWNTPSFWGIGVLNKPPDNIFISRQPLYWYSDDIKALFCRVTAAADPPTPTDFMNAPARNTPGWYRYDNTLITPCPLYLLVQIRRTGGLTDPDNPGSGVVKKRVLSLWAENGANPIKWTTINLTGPIDLQPGTGLPNNEFLAVTDFNWTNVPANQINGHPCIRAFILPENLNLPNTNPTLKRPFPRSTRVSSRRSARRSKPPPRPPTS